MTCCATTSAPSRATERTFRPAVDVTELEDGYRLEADLPGASKDDVELDLNEGVLTISAKVARREEGDVKYHLREYGVGDFERKIRLGDQIDRESIRAELESGVLTLHLPKVQAALPRRIEIA